MSFTDLFIKKPVLSISFNLILFIVGLTAIGTLTVRQYPRSDSSVATIQTIYIGANAELVKGFITTPLERVISSIEGIDFLESESRQGLSTIKVHLKLNFDTNDALTQIQSKIAQVRNDLPPEAESSTINIESADNRIASMYMSFYSPTLKQNQITDYLTRVVQPRISSVSGVQKAEVIGARTFAMRIWLDPELMAAKKISPSHVRQALIANNYLSTVGNTKGSMISVNLAADTDLRTKEDFQELIVHGEKGNFIRLRDIADIELGSESTDEDVRFGGETATFMGIWVLPTANSLEVIKRVREEMPGIQVGLPAGMNAKIAYDSTKYIQDAINEVLHTLLETIIIVIIVIYLFMGSFRSVLVPVVAIPLSLVGAASVMMLFGFTINLLTLLGIVLAVGIVVDDAIVMLENIERHISSGIPPTEAALKGARELVLPTISMTLTLAAVYAPIGLQGGLTGSLFREFAFTLAGAVVVSGIVALTLSPMMSSKLIKANHNPNKFQIFITDTFNKLKEKYTNGLLIVIQNKAIVYIVTGFLILLIPGFYMLSNKELAPKEDQGVVFGIINAAPDSTLDQTLKYAEQVTKVYKQIPESDNIFQLTTPTGGFSGVVTKPWSERKRTTTQISMELSKKLGAIAGIQTIATTPAPLPGGSDFPIELIISSTADAQELLGYAQQIVGAAYQSRLMPYVDTDLKFDKAKSEIEIDRDKVAALGLNLAQVGADLSIMLGGNYTNRFSIQGRSYKVIPQVKRSSRLTPESVLDYYIADSLGNMIPVSAIAKISNKVEPRTLNKFQQLNSAKIFGVLPGGPDATIDNVLKKLEKVAKEILPKSYIIDYAGESRQLRKEGNSLVKTLLLAVIVIFLVLACQFGSFRDPLIILLGSVPLALSGALFFVFSRYTSINVYSQVGLITLVGLISKNGILIVEFANKLQESGLDKVSAVIESATTRLRPILMTSVATVIGHFPLVIAAGAGAGSRNSIGIVLVSGMTIGTILTLFIIPVIYILIAKDHRHE